MVTQHTFKGRVRTRMAKTGESYTAARRMLIAAGDAPESEAALVAPPVADDAITKATGRGWDAWYADLDGRGATSLSHAEIAKRLVADGVPGWWAQTITVGYERARGMRAVGQLEDGWRVTASRTIAVVPLVADAAVTHVATRERWLPGAELRLRTHTAGKVARYDWEDGETRVTVFFDGKGDAATTVTLEHTRLPDADTADAMKAFWRARVADLKALLETPDGDTVA